MTPDRDSLAYRAGFALGALSVLAIPFLIVFDVVGVGHLFGLW